MFDIPEYYQRNVHAYTLEEQIKLLTSKVIILGVGGGGCVVAEILARTGVGFIKLVDGDSFELSNCNRQIGALTDTIGLNKALVMKERLKKVNPAIEFIAIPDFISEQNYETILDGCDIVCDTVDKGINKKMVAKFCSKMNKPYVTGGLANSNFHVTSFKAGEDGGFIYKEDNAPIFANPASVFIQGGLQAQEIINLLLDRECNLQGKVLRFSHIDFNLSIGDY